MSDWLKTWTEQWSAVLQPAMQARAPGADHPAETAARSPLEAQYDELRAVWQDSFAKWTAFASGGAAIDKADPETLRRLFSADQWSGLGAMEQTLRRVLDGPRYATLWEMDRKMAELQRLALLRDQSIARYQAVVARAWASASERFASSFVKPDGEAPATWRALTDRWLQVANATLIEAYRTDEFIETQRAMLRAASDYRLQERAIAELYCEAAHIPTRTEMDDVQRELTELRRRVRTMSREASTGSARAIASAPFPTTADAGRAVKSAKTAVTRKTAKASRPATTAKTATKSARRRRATGARA